MGSSQQDLERGLPVLCEQLRRIPAVLVEKAGGEADDEGWWAVSVTIDRRHPGSWRAVAILANVFNAEPAGNGRALFHPLAGIRGPCDEDVVILWSLGHSDGDYTPLDAAKAIDKCLADIASVGNVED